MSDEAGPAAADAPKKKSSGAGWGCLGLALAPVLLFASCMISTASGDDDDETYVEPAADVVERACFQAVESQLRAPATAQIGEDYRSTVDDGTYQLTGVVDAENGFGALIRSSWSCTAQWDDADLVARVTDVSVE